MGLSSEPLTDLPVNRRRRHQQRVRIATAGYYWSSPSPSQRRRRGPDSDRLLALHNISISYAGRAGATQTTSAWTLHGATVVWSKVATATGTRGSEVAFQCGKTIQGRTIVVELRFPKELPSASLSEGVVFVSRFKDGYQVWERAH
jgi:hypothetical protein